MSESQKSLCVFIHFSNKTYIPLYVKIYVDEIAKFFDQVILVTNERTENAIVSYSRLNISTVFVKNEGYDLGMFYKVFRSINPEEYAQIGCVNDSNILFNNLHPIFKWSKEQQLDFWGAIDSNQKPVFSTHKNNYHIQSHFIVFNRRAISKLTEFFNSIHIQDMYDETDSKLVRQKVINDWEIGLSQYLINEGLTCKSYIDSQTYSQLYHSGKSLNVSLKLYPELIRSGLPLLKLKVITKGKWKDLFRTHSYWKNLIRRYGNKDWEIEDLIKELIKIKNDSGNQPIVKLKRLFLKNSYKEQ
jgi:lipopolysaccharide biosynthesis protein